MSAEAGTQHEGSKDTGLPGDSSVSGKYSRWHAHRSYSLILIPANPQEVQSNNDPIVRGDIGKSGNTCL
eukprot:2802783-Pleurochrysis_carterae.AAC.1